MTRLGKIKNSLRAAIGVAILAAAVALPSQALAQSDCSSTHSNPSEAQYCEVSGVTGGGNTTPQSGTPQSGNVSPEGSGVEPVATSSAPAPVESSGSGTLPFTGLDVGILLVVAAALLTTGIVLRRFTASGEPGR